MPDQAATNGGELSVFRGGQLLHDRDFQKSLGDGKGGTQQFCLLAVSSGNKEGRRTLSCSDPVSDAGVIGNCGRLRRKADPA